MPEQKKIVLIMTDSQRWDMVNCYRDTGLKTPYIDKLASEGVKFTSAYTTSPVCGPARSAIFSGLFPHSNGVVTNSVPYYGNVKSVGQRLQDNGFHTAYIGKWHLDGGDYFGMGRCPDGWDAAYWYDMRNYLEELTDDERLLSRQISVSHNIPETFTFGHRCSNRAIDFLQNHSDEDFLLVISYDEPHGPFVCPEPYASMYQDYTFPKSQNVYDTLQDKPIHQHVWAGDAVNYDRDEITHNGLFYQAYFGCNSFVDAEIGRMMDAIDTYAPDTLVIYTSDHGDMLSSHSMGGKGPCAYDEITKVPFIIRKPGFISSGINYDQPVSHIDITPTILAYANIPIPKLLEGKSLLPTCQDTATPVNDVIFMEFGRYEIDHDGFGGFQPMRTAFDGQWKLTVNLLSSDELYDLKNDPDELHNLINDPAVAQTRNDLHDKLLQWINDTRDPFRGYYWEQRPWRQDARPATWDYTKMTRQREHEEYEPRQLDYNTGLAMEEAVREKG